MKMAPSAHRVPFDVVFRSAEGEEHTVATVDVDVHFAGVNSGSTDTGIWTNTRSCSCLAGQPPCQRNPETGEGGHLYGGGSQAGSA
jgi:hypothetical protein